MDGIGFVAQPQAKRRSDWGFRGQNGGVRANGKIPVAAATSVDAGAMRKFSKAKSIAERLGVCPRTIFRWADAGNIARHKINARVVLFDEAEVAAFIESTRVQAR